MKNKILLIVLITIFNAQLAIPCTMYKITINGKTIVGNNEDWISPNSQFWFEPATNHKFGVMYMGLLNNFAQGGINEAGLVFDGFANPELPVNNTEGKAKVYIGTAIKNIMQEMQTVEEVKIYLSTINLSSLSSSQIVFVDKSGTYLIVEGDELIIGDEKEKAFSNFYYSQISSEKDIKLENFKNGLKFLKKSKGKSSLTYCGKAMQEFSSSKLFGTQYSTIYDLNTLKIRIYLFQDYSEYVEIDLKEELKKGEHKTMIANLFPKASIGFKHYSKYNNSEEPTLFLEDIVNKRNSTEDDLIAMGFNSILNSIGYEWLRQLKNPEAAIKIFKYGVSLMPNNADLYDSLGEAYLINDNWENAIINYAKSLVLNPENDNAIEKLSEAKKYRGKFKEKPFKQLTVLVDQYSNGALSNNNLNSASVAIYRNGNTYHNYYGTLKKDAKNKPNDSTLFEIASISKVFVGSLVSQAVLEGKIKLDDDIRKYLKNNDYPNLEFEGTPITIKNLVTHTIGFDTPNGLKNIYNKIDKGLYKNKELDYDMNSLLEELKTVELTEKPGTFYNYNNVGSELAAYILEQVNNRSYKEQLQSFLDKLDMKNTYLQDFEKHSKHLAIGYDEKNNPAPIDKNPLIGGSAGMISTLPDLMKLMKFQLESNNPIVKEATQFLYKDNNGNAMGYLWQDMGVAKDEGFYYSKTGDANGIKSGMLICPGSNYGQIVIVNNQTEAAYNDWAKLFSKIETDLIRYPKVNLYNLTKPYFIKNKNIGLAKFNTLKKQTNSYFNTDLTWTLNVISYDLLNKKETKKAIEMFKFAIEQDSKNPNLYDSLGEAYFVDKNYKNALINYHKSLELNPKNGNAKKYIEKINLILKR